MDQDTTLVDIYEAAGGTANEDRTQVSMSPPLKPFEIILKVVPTGVAYEGTNRSTVTFSVLVADTVTIHDYGVMHHFQHDVEITLPTEQIQILKKE